MKTFIVLMLLSLISIQVASAAGVSGIVQALETAKTTKAIGKIKLFYPRDIVSDDAMTSIFRTFDEDEKLLFAVKTKSGDQVVAISHNNYLTSETYVRVSLFYVTKNKTPERQKAFISAVNNVMEKSGGRAFVEDSISRMPKLSLFRDDLDNMDLGDLEEILQNISRL